MNNKWLRRVSLLAVIFAWLVIGLGAFTRLKAAGLGCPDWPGCYGHVMPEGGSEKAWIEMIHRYCAGTLVLLIVVITFLSLLRVARQGGNLLLWCLLVFLMVIYQALLGMWTVTLKLWPIVVSQHLLGGMIILALLWIIHLKSRDFRQRFIFAGRDKFFAVMALILVFSQISLGAWTSTNYAGISCHDFPFCHWSQTMHYRIREAFNLMIPPGINYEGGVLNEVVRQTIQMVHRWGALVMSSYLIFLGIYLIIRYPNCFKLQRIILFMLILLILQVILGIVNVVAQLPLVIAVMHNLFAALLLVSVVSINFYILSASKVKEYGNAKLKYSYF